jgi:hypothetical protein
LNYIDSKITKVMVSRVSSSSTKLEKREEQVLPGREARGVGRRKKG